MPPANLQGEALRTGTLLLLWLAPCCGALRTPRGRTSKNSSRTWTPRLPRKAWQHRSAQCVARLEGLRAEAREILRTSGDHFLDEACRGGATGVRSVSVVMKERERAVRAQSRGLATAGAVVAGLSRPAPYAKPPPPARATAQAPRQRSRPPAARTVEAKTEAVIHQVDPSFQSSRARPGTASEVAAIVAAMALANIPKAKGVEILEQSCVAQTIAVGAEVGFVLVSGDLA